MNNRSIDICLHVMACSQAGIEVSLDKNIFADGRCSGESVQLDLLCSSHRDRLFLYAQPCPWCSKWVSKESYSASRSLVELKISNLLCLISKHKHKIQVSIME